MTSETKTRIKIKQKPHKLSPFLKTETVTLRLDPKTKFGLELLARKQYRTLSSVVEWAINDALRDKAHGIPQLDEIWDIEEADRLVKLAILQPNFLSYEEQLIWKIISETPTFWKGNYKDKLWTWTCSVGSAVFDRIRKSHSLILSVVRGENNASVLPSKELRQDPDEDLV